MSPYRMETQPCVCVCVCVYLHTNMAFIYILH